MRKNAQKALSIALSLSMTFSLMAFGGMSNRNIAKADDTARTSLNGYASEGVAEEVTVVGKDTVGIIAKVCTYLANNNVNILDINQTITGGFFNMMMIVESEEVVKTFPVMASELEQIGEELGVKIQAQHQEIFEMMHRI